MYPVFAPVLKLLKFETVTTDNNVFRLHYKVTMFILVAFSLLLTQKQYFGDPIDCKSSVDSGLEPDKAKLIDTFCWIQSTYSLPQVHHGPYPGVHNPHNPETSKPHDKKHHTYYQWVTLFLYFQAMLFYLPRYWWKIIEGGKLKMLVGDLQMPVTDEAVTKKKKEVLLFFFKNNLHSNNWYAYNFVLCEILNFVNVIAQIFITNVFVGYEFTDYGTRVFETSEQPWYERHDPLEYVFPKVTKCDFHFYGRSGSHQNIDALCVLPLNIFNEKIYVVLWFWFIIVAVVTFLGLVYRAATFFSPVRKLLLKAKAKISHPDDVTIVNYECDYGDWFLLYQIAKNMELTTFKEFMKELAEDFKMK